MFVEIFKQRPRRVRGFAILLSLGLWMFVKHNPGPSTVEAQESASDGRTLAVMVSADDMTSEKNPVGDQDEAMLRTALATSVAESEHDKELTISHIVLPGMKWIEGPAQTILKSMRHSPNGTYVGYLAVQLSPVATWGVLIENVKTGVRHWIVSQSGTGHFDKNLINFMWRSDSRSIFLFERFTAVPKPVDWKDKARVREFEESQRVEIAECSVDSSNWRARVAVAGRNAAIHELAEGALLVAYLDNGEVVLVRVDSTNAMKVQDRVKIDPRCSDLSFSRNGAELWYTATSESEIPDASIRYFTVDNMRAGPSTFMGHAYLRFFDETGTCMLYVKDDRYIVTEPQKHTHLLIGEASQLPVPVAMESNGMAVIFKGYMGGYVSGKSVREQGTEKFEGIYRMTFGPT